MSSFTFYFLLIPVLALVLLAVNFIFATHTPYQEKNSAFECGFHSFLGQNRMQFNISFYIFGLLFLLFDLEILLIYPYPTSAYFNSIYGLCIMIIFFLVLTLGFAFELGKNALKIDSRQYTEDVIEYKKNLNLLNNGFLFNRNSIINFIISVSVIFTIYISIRYIFTAPILLTPYEEQPVDIEYLEDQVYSIQETIKENNLHMPKHLLTKDQLMLKKEANEALRETIKDLRDLKSSLSQDKLDETEQIIKSAKRLADTISEDNSNLVKDNLNASTDSSNTNVVQEDQVEKKRKII